MESSVSFQVSVNALHDLTESMRIVSRSLLSLGLLGTVTSTIYCGMVVAAAVRFGRRRRREQSQVASFLPPVSMLKPLHGTEPGMERNLETFF